VSLSCASRSPPADRREVRAPHRHGIRPVCGDWLVVRRCRPCGVWFVDALDHRFNLSSRELPRPRRQPREIGWSRFERRGGRPVSCALLTMTGGTVLSIDILSLLNRGSHCGRRLTDDRRRASDEGDPGRENLCPASSVQDRPHVNTSTRGHSPATPRSSKSSRPLESRWSEPSPRHEAARAYSLRAHRSRRSL